MNRLIEEGSILEKDCGNNLTYILNDSTLFLPTEYKVFQNQEAGVFVKGVKMLFNGKIQLFYLTNEYRSLASLIPNMDAGRFMMIMTNILENILAVRQNGFLYCRNIDLSFDRLYVDPTTYKVYFLYLPLSRGIYEDETAFEDELRLLFYMAISNKKYRLNSSKTRIFAGDLTNASFTIRNLYERAKKILHEDSEIDSLHEVGGAELYQGGHDPADEDRKNKTPERYPENSVSRSDELQEMNRSSSTGPNVTKPTSNNPKTGTDQFLPGPYDVFRHSDNDMTEFGKSGDLHAPGELSQETPDILNIRKEFEEQYRTSMQPKNDDTQLIQHKRLKLSELNAAQPTEFIIGKDHYVIGKNPDLVDGVILHNPSVSRVHCRIIFKDDCFYAEDQNSANGTYINGVRIPSETPFQLCSGDILRLSNISFRAMVTE